LEVLEVKFDSLDNNMLWADYDANKEIFVDDTFVIHGKNFPTDMSRYEFWYVTNDNVGGRIEFNDEFEMISMSSDQIVFSLKTTLLTLDGGSIGVTYLGQDTYLANVFYNLPVRLSSNPVFNHNHSFFNSFRIYFNDLPTRNNDRFPKLTIDERHIIGGTVSDFDDPEGRYNRKISYSLPDIEIGEHIIQVSRSEASGSQIVPMRIESENTITVGKMNFCFAQNEYALNDTIVAELYAENASPTTLTSYFYTERKLFLVDAVDNDLRFQCTNVRYEFAENPRNTDYTTTYFYFTPPEDIPPALYEVKYELPGGSFDFDTESCDNSVINLTL
jgi:hypothetical protein